LIANLVANGLKLSVSVAEEAAAIGLVEGFIGSAKSLVGHLRDTLCDPRQRTRTERVGLRSAIDQ
jgi:hypothetical protein